MLIHFLGARLLLTDTMVESVSEILQRVVEMEAEMKELSNLVASDATPGAMNVSMKDAANIRFLLQSARSFRLFARDALQVLGKHHPRAKNWAEQVFNEDCHE